MKKAKEATLKDSLLICTMYTSENELLEVTDPAQPILSIIE